jgi:hypothetical protein
MSAKLNTLTVTPCTRTILPSSGSDVARPRCCGQWRCSQLAVCTPFPLLVDSEAGLLVNTRMLTRIYQSRLSPLSASWCDFSLLVRFQVARGPSPTPFSTAAATSESIDGQPGRGGRGRCPGPCRSGTSRACAHNLRRKRPRLRLRSSHSLLGAPFKVSQSSRRVLE